MDIKNLQRLVYPILCLDYLEMDLGTGTLLKHGILDLYNGIFEMT